MISQSSYSEPLGSRGFVHKRIGRGLKKFGGLVPGVGPAIQAVGGFLAGSPGGQIVQTLVPPRPRGPGSRTRVLPQPQLVLPQQVAPGQAQVVTTPAQLGTTGFQAVSGAFGLPAMAPVAEMRRHLACPRGMVLGQDELCYPKQVLRRNSKFRKWHSGPRPPISAADAKMFRRLKSAREAVKKFGTVAGLKISNK